MQPDRPYRNISQKRELVDAVESFIQRVPQLGYRSLAEFYEDAARKRLEELEGFKEIGPSWLVAGGDLKKEISITTDVDGRINAVSPGAQNLFPNVRVGNSMAEVGKILLTPESFAEMQATVNKILQNGKLTGAIDLKYKDGTNKLVCFFANVETHQDRQVLLLRIIPVRRSLAFSVFQETEQETQEPKTQRKNRDNGITKPHIDTADR